MKSKKAMELSLSTVVIMVALLITLALIIYIATTQLTGGSEKLKTLTPSSSVTCAIQPGVKAPDIDRDGLKDTCDNCVCPQPNGCRNMEYDFSNPLNPKVKKSNDDNDQDGLPKACDENDNDADKTGWSDLCKEQIKKTKTGQGRCVLT